MSQSASHKANQLIDSTSPYLLQHAYNPVNWYPWSEEALHKAKDENKIIILSIGYSACHWCHVMERECFENEDLAALMNANFINIKVDREERPDIDQIYMDALHAMGMNGGWPLNVFLLPDLKPFYGGTYFPAPSWKQVLENINRAFASQRKDLEADANTIFNSIQLSEIKKYDLMKVNENSPNWNKIANQLSQKFDLMHGGNQRAPKFPMPCFYEFLLRLGQLKENENIESHCFFTLEKMYLGGIYDHLVGGFARYSTDVEWFAPHFEKMLYDNAQLLSLYAEAYTIKPSEMLKDAVFQTINFIKNEMTSHENAFYSAQDADSEGIEGEYYVWKYTPFKETVENKDFEILSNYFQLSEEGNWEHGKNILHRNTSDIDFAKQNNLSFTEWIEIKDKNIAKLKLARDKRIKPGLDDKIIVSWNSMTTKGLLMAYRTWQNNDFLALAEKNANFIVSKMTLPNQQLWHTYKNGKAHIIAFLDDYAHTIDAFIALYECTLEEKWLNYALKYYEYVSQNFKDEAEPMFFYTDKKAEALIARKKEIMDNVIPSSNAILASCMLKLAYYYDKLELEKEAKKMTKMMHKIIDGDTYFCAKWASLALEAEQKSWSISIVGENANIVLKEIMPLFPHQSLFSGYKDKTSLPILIDKPVKSNETLIYACFGKTCFAPISNISALKDLINNKSNEI